MLLLVASFSYAKEKETTLLESYKKAIKVYEASPHSYKETFALAQIAFDAGNFKQAYDLLFNILQKYKNDKAALILYADVLIQYGYEQRARNKLNTIIDLYPSSKASLSAKSRLNLLDRLHNPVQSKYILKASAGIDSLPSLEEDSLFSDYTNSFVCQDGGLSCTYITRFEETVHPYVDLAAQGDYLYDMGATGSFFTTYGWGIQSRSYLTDLDAGNYEVNFNFGGGYATQDFGSFHFKLNPAIHYTKLSPYDEPTLSSYDIFKFSLQYRYRFESKDLLTFGLLREEYSAGDDFYIDFNSDLIKDFNETMYFNPTRNIAYIEYRGTTSDSGHKYKLRLGSGDVFRSYDDFSGYSIPFSDYDISISSFSFLYNASPSKKYSISTSITEKEYFQVYDTSTSDLREDSVAEVNLQVIYLNQKLSKSVLGYKLYANESNYQPYNFVKHELYYSYYWLP